MAKNLVAPDGISIPFADGRRNVVAHEVELALAVQYIDALSGTSVSRPWAASPNAIPKRLRRKVDPFRPSSYRSLRGQHRVVFGEMRRNSLSSQPLAVELERRTALRDLPSTQDSPDNKSGR